MPTNKENKLKIFELMERTRAMRRTNFKSDKVNGPNTIIRIVNEYPKLFDYEGELVRQNYVVAQLNPKKV